MSALLIAVVCTAGFALSILAGYRLGKGDLPEPVPLSARVKATQELLKAHLDSSRKLNQDLIKALDSRKVAWQPKPKVKTAQYDRTVTLTTKLSDVGEMLIRQTNRCTYLRFKKIGVSAQHRLSWKDFSRTWTLGGKPNESPLLMFTHEMNGEPEHVAELLQSYMEDVLATYVDKDEAVFAIQLHGELSIKVNDEVVKPAIHEVTVVVPALKVVYVPLIHVDGEIYTPEGHIDKEDLAARTAAAAELNRVLQQ